MNIKQLKSLITKWEEENPPDDYLGVFEDNLVLVGTDKGMSDKIEVWFDPLMGLCIDKEINAN